MGTEQVLVGVETVQTGTERVKVGTESVQVGTERVKTGTETVQTGTERVKVGTETVQIGTEQVKVGTQTVQIGTEQVKTGEQTVVVGSRQVKTGERMAVVGSETVVTGQRTRTEEGPEQLVGLKSASGYGVGDRTDLLGAASARLPAGYIEALFSVLQRPEAGKSDDSVRAEYAGIDALGQGDEAQPASWRVKPADQTQDGKREPAR